MKKSATQPQDMNHASEVGRLGAVVNSALGSAGFDRETAAKYSLFAMEIYRYILEHPKTLAAVKELEQAYEAIDGSKRIQTASGYMRRARAVGLSSAQSGFTAYGLSGAAAVLEVFRERFEALAKAQGVELNACAMALSSLSLNIAAAGIGSVSAVTGFGLVLTAYAALGVFKGGYEVAQVCRPHKAP